MNPHRCVVDFACIGSIGATVLGWLPGVLASVAALLACVWYGIEIYDRLKGTHDGR